ncbi:MAG TPA: anti-sigma factor antagonist [Firmicutes bacterium]|nr:anti-sigma factor antagonist [Bacillota bacterium]
MDIHFRKRGKTIIAEIGGDIDHRYSEEIRRLTERELYISGADSLVLDMSGVKFMDSSGIGMIIGRYKTVSALGGKLSIAAPSKEADRILAISGIYRIIHSYKTVEDAVLGINQEVHKNEK